MKNWEWSGDGATVYYVTSLLSLFLRVGLINFSFYPQNFRTSSEQPDCHKYSTISEMYPALETYVSALSGGPIGPSDQIGTANVTLIMATW